MEGAGLKVSLVLQNFAGEKIRKMKSLDLPYIPGKVTGIQVKQNSVMKERRTLKLLVKIVKRKGLLEFRRFCQRTEVQLLRSRLEEQRGRAGNHDQEMKQFRRGFAELGPWGANGV